MKYYVYKSTKDTAFIAVQKKSECVLIKECDNLKEAKETRDSFNAAKNEGEYEL